MKDAAIVMAASNNPGSNRRLFRIPESPLPQLPFRTVVADPPWPGPIGDWRANPLVVQPHSMTKHGRKAPSNVYKLMSLEEIESCAPVTAEKAHLWLWSLPQHVDWAYRIARTWGFEPLHVIAWAKPGYGTGGFQANTEYVLLARKGGTKNNAFGRMPGTHYRWPRTSRHSRKPSEFFSLVESVSPGPYLEMFARGPRPNWTVWGDEATATPRQTGPSSATTAGDAGPAGPVSDASDNETDDR